MTKSNVSVVIPTYQRHNEVLCAVHSALAQTMPPCEVIVVNDGPDPEKARRIAALQDSRVRYHEAPLRANAAATRNAGIRVAKGDWIALLDDDDTWLPHKLEAQFAALQRSGVSEAILAGRESVHMNGRHLHDRPRKPVPGGTTADSLLFCGPGGVHTSTLVAPTSAFRQHPFDDTLERHEDWSWILHAGRTLPIIVADDVVCERHLRPGTGLSRPGGVEFSRAWYQAHRHLMSPDARAAFVSGTISAKAAYDGPLSLLLWMLSELRSERRLRLRHVARMLRPWVIPYRVRAFLRYMMARS